MGEFGGDGLAEWNSADAPDHRHQRSVSLGPVDGIDFRAVFGRHVAGVENVLQRDRQTAQWFVLEPFRERRLARAVEVERDEGSDLALALGDGFGAKFQRLRGCEFAGFKPAGKVDRREHQTVPPISMRMRLVMRRAVGMKKKPVIAAIGQPTI